MIKKVAVPALKHSPMLGQEASSQTVFNAQILQNRFDRPNPFPLGGFYS
jgi:hypothetical protein